MLIKISHGNIDLKLFNLDNALFSIDKYTMIYLRNKALPVM